MNDRTKFVALDWLRFSLAVYLVFYHTQYFLIEAHAGFYQILGLGNMATSVFFVLSGFLLTHVYASSKNSIRINQRKFWIARFTTLYPLHIFGFLLCLPLILRTALKQGGIEVPVDLGSDTTRLLSLGETSLGLLSYLTLTHAWNPFYLLFNVPSWSLSALLFFYLLFPYLAPRLAAVRAPLAWIAVLYCAFSLPGAIAYLYNFMGLVADGILHRNPIVRLPLFLSGILLYSIYRDRRDSQFASTKKRVLEVVLVLLISLTVYTGASFYTPQKEALFPLVRNSLYFPAALAIVWLAANMNVGTSGWGERWAARLGKSSLSIFMLHIPLFWISLIAERYLRAWAASGFALSNLGSVAAAARDVQLQAQSYLIHVTIIIVICVLFHERIVTPLQDLIRRKLTGKTAAGSHRIPTDSANPDHEAPALVR